MEQDVDRLEHLLATEPGDGAEETLQDRLETLHSYQESRPMATRADVTALQTLGDDTRYTIVRLLHNAGQELCVCEITPLIDVSDSAVSHALSDLYHADLLTRRKDGQWRYYATTDRADALITALDTTREDDT